MNSAAESFKARCELLRAEQSRLASSLAESRTIVTDILQPGSIKIVTRLAAAADKQTKLKKRIDLSTQLLMEMQHPALSQFEIKWMGEIQEFRGKVSSFKRRVDAIHSHFNALKPLAAGKNYDDEEMPGEFQIKSVLSTIENEGKFIEQLTRSVHRLQIQVDTLEEMS